MKTEQTVKDKKASAYKGVDDLFAKPEDAKAATDKAKGGADEIVLLNLAELYDFEGHPFAVRDDDAMQELIASIKVHGVMEPITVIPREGGGNTIVAGHRRKYAAMKAGLTQIRGVVKNMSRDEAIITMVDSNLHRPEILPSERAKSIKMKMDARKRQGQKDGNGKKKRTDEEIADEMGISRNSVQRLVRLLELSEPLLKMVDEKRLSENPAYELSFLPKVEQALVQDWMEREERSPTQSQCMMAKQHSLALQADKKNPKKQLTQDDVDRIMEGERILEIYPFTEKEKEKETKAQAEKEAAAAPQIPASVAPPTSAPGQEKPGEASVPDWTKDDTPEGPEAPEVKGIPVQFPGGGTSTIPPGAPSATSTPQQTPAAPAATTQEQSKSQADAAMKSYIRSQYMAEIRTENIILPKADVKKLLPRCDSNAEYIAAITAALTDAKAVQLEMKATKAPATPPKAPEPSKVGSPASATPPKAPEPSKAGGTAPATPPKAAEPAKVGNTDPATPSKATEPVKPGSTAPATPPKATEPVKPGSTAPATPPKATELVKPGGTAPATPPKAPEPAKMDNPAPITPPKAPEPVKAGMAGDKPSKGTEALDEYLMKKGKQMQKGRTPQVPGRTK